MGLLDAFNSPEMALAAGLLGGGNFGQALGRGMAGAEAQRLAAGRAEAQRALIEEQRMKNEQARAAMAQQSAIQQAAQQSYRTPQYAEAMSIGPAPEGRPRQEFKAGMDMPGFLNRVMQINPIEGMKLQSQLAKESQINKLDVKDFTPDSVQRFNQTGNYGDLQRMDKLEFRDTGGTVAGLNPFTGQRVSDLQKTGNPFSDLVLRDNQGNIIPNTPLVGVKAGLAQAGATRVNNQVSIAGPENEYNKNIGSGLAKEGLALVESAKKAPEVVRNAQMIRTAIGSGAITGTGADTRLVLQRALETAGLVGAGEGKAANTEALVSGLANLTLAGVQSSGLGAGNGFTDKDREFLQAAKSGTIAMTPANIIRAADLSERVAVANYKKGSDVLSRWQKDPSLKAVSQDTTLDHLPTGQQKPPVQIPAKAIAELKMRGKSAKAQFDAAFGAGAADSVLGGN